MHKQTGSSAVSLAACNGRLQVVRLMVNKYGCNVEERSQVTHWCLESIHAVCLYLLCQVHIVLVQNGSTPLLGAALFGHLHIVRELIEKMNADVLAQTTVC